MHCVAITGGTGFLGKRLVPKLLAAGYDVRLASRSKTTRDLSANWCQINLATASDSEIGQFLSGCDTVIHMAGEINDASKMRALHVDATRRLVNAATTADISHWLQLSSCGVYGPVRSGTIFEDSEKAPCGEYEVTKWQSEQIVLQWARDNDKRITILRPAIIWSADMPNNSLRSLIYAVYKGLFFYIGRTGSNYPAVHVDDVADAIKLAIQHKSIRQGIFNLSDNIPIETLITTIAEIIGKRPPRLRVPETLAKALACTSAIIPAMPLTRSRVDALTSRAIYSSEAARSALGWQPKIALRDGLAALVHAVNGGEIPT